MLHALTLAAAIAVGGPLPDEVVQPTTVLEQPPRVVEVRPKVVVRPRRTVVVRRPPVYVYPDDGCGRYNCAGPETTFRLPDEVPEPYYYRQYSRPGNYDVYDLQP